MLVQELVPETGELELEDNSAGESGLEIDSISESSESGSGSDNLSGSRVPEVQAVSVAPILSLLLQVQRQVLQVPFHGL